MAGVTETECMERVRCLRLEMQDNMKDLQKQIKDKLSHGVFVIVVSIAIAVIGGMFTLTMSEVKDVQNSVDYARKNITITKEDVGYIKGKIENLIIKQ